MPSSNYLLRLGFIYETLTKEACDINALLKILKEKKVNVLKRQVYRDIEAIKKSFLVNNDKLIETFVNNKKKVWKIVNQSQKSELNIEGLHNLILLRDTLPLWIEPGIQKNIKTTIDFFLNTYCHQSPISIQIPFNTEAITNTNFYQKFNDKNEYNIYKDLYWCIVSHKKFLVKRKIWDFTCVPYSKKEFLFTPIKFIYHRGSIYIGGLVENRKILILDISQIKEYSISDKKFKSLPELDIQFDKELKNRFGVSENIDTLIYDIEIECSADVGDFIKKVNWHHSQKFRLTKTGYIMSLKCGINRELVSWVFMWMDNIRILKPQKLKSLYLTQLNRIQELNTNNSNLSYSNIFMNDG